MNQTKAAHKLRQTRRWKRFDTIAHYIDGFYNPVRRHSALNHLSPALFERQAAD